MTGLRDTLLKLVGINSVTGSEGRLCTAIAERLLPTWNMNGVRRIGNSLVAGADTGRPLITIYGHIDTVPSQGNEEPRIDGDIVYGLGTSDMKAGLAVMIHLLEDPVVAAGPYDVVGGFYDKEEGPMEDNGLEEVIDRAPWLENAELAVVMEPTDLELQLGCNGAMNATVSFLGQSAHSARPWLGDNAVTKAGAWLASMYARAPEPFEVAGLEFHEVFSVTKATGGIANNIIPPRFDVNLNYRFPPVYSLEQAEQRLRAVTAEADEVDVFDRAPAGTIDADNPHLRRLEEVTKAPRTGKQGWTDVARLTSRGIPAVNYGPGVVAQAHQASEHVPISNMETAFQLLREFLIG